MKIVIWPLVAMFDAKATRGMDFSGEEKIDKCTLKALMRECVA